MSIVALNWAWQIIPRVELKPSSSLVLLALAHCHFEDTGRCDPSNAYLRRKTGLSERGVRDAVKELADKKVVGVIYRQARTGRGKRNLNNRYVLKGGAKSAGRMGQDLPALRDMAGKTPTAFYSLIQGDDFELEDCTDGGKRDA